jgi:hypothetical protein
LDVTEKPYQLVAFERFKDRDWNDVYTAIRRRKQIYGGRVVVDSTGLGDVVISEIADVGPEGFNFGKGGGKAKTELLSNLELYHAKKEVAYPFLEQTGSEGEYWSNLQEFREASWDSEISGDFIMALGLALWPLRMTAEERDKKPVDPRLSKV